MIYFINSIVVLYVIYNRSLIGKTLVFETKIMCSNHIENREIYENIINHAILYI